MRILVTGYNGFIGRHVTKRLIEDGHTVFGIDDLSNSSDDFDLIDNDNRFFHFNICWDDDRYRRLADDIGQIDCILHLAAKARVQASFKFPLEWHDTNVTGTLRLLEFAKVNKIKKFIFSSSSSVYGLSTKYSLFEDSKLHPLSPYALQKVQAEQLCEFYHNTFGIQAISLRYFNVYGENQPISGNYPQLVPILLQKCKENEPFVIYGDGEQRRDFTYVKDVVEANILAMQSKETGLFNIGSGTNYSVNEICDMIDPNHPRQYEPERPEPRITLANNYKAYAKLKWKPTVNLASWIKSQI